ncbi:hypothetical protein HUN88_13235 [Bacillus amyloliquefaciens]|uniref:hypothetical protein n=1 Tax=Bacillus amyloliquefaciens group TaxID=1938374 RepID=UPI000F8ECF82|nr:MULTISPECIES: hypothetical protein [Bacillus amyloliquefaciens group]NUI60717.1 hypothetical protein [Bacillus amyloliquefaciens]QLG06249.1 hypothetical protein GJS30_03745 [Bacillus velezensis]BET16501.1 hypothetical protein RBIBE_04910 [Bacillus velezensis]
MSNYSVFQVIKIIDEYSIVINGGFNDDVSLGDKIEVFIEGEEVIDHFNDNKILGKLDFIKETLEVVESYPNFSVCKKLITKSVHHPSNLQKAISSTWAASSSSLKSALSGFTETVTEERKINVDEEQISGRVRGEKVIKLGDTVRIAIGRD